MRYAGWGNEVLVPALCGNTQRCAEDATSFANTSYWLLGIVSLQPICVSFKPDITRSHCEG